MDKSPPISFWAIKNFDAEMLNHSFSPGQLTCISLSSKTLKLFVAGYETKVFETRKDAREFIKEHCPDLTYKPHGWKVPVPVKVIISVSEK